MIGLLLLAGQAAFSVLNSRVVVSFHHEAPNQIRHYRPDATYIRGIYGESTFTTNSLGIRGPEMDSAYGRRLVCIGASTTEGLYLDDRETWPYLCGQHLQEHSSEATVWVGNVGHAGYTTAQHLRYIQQNEQFSEYDTAVFLIGAGDLLIWLISPELAPVPVPVWRESGYFSTTRSLLGTLWPWTDPMSLDPTGSNYQIRRQQRANSHILDVDLKVGKMLARYRKRIVDIVEACRKKGVQPVLLTQPTLWTTNGEPDAEAVLWMGRLKNRHEYLSVPKLRELIDRLNDVVLSVSSTHDVPCVNLEHMNGHEEFFYDDFHYTEAGARVVAEAVADVLLDTAKLQGRAR